jgi:hypothetical protein
MMNDERPIEKLLRRAAQKRAAEAGSPPELHPANRRLLQAEVAKQFPRPAAPPASAGTEFWTGLRARWAYALAIIPVVGILAFVLVPALFKGSNQQMAFKSSESPAAFQDEALTPEENAPLLPKSDVALTTITGEKKQVTEERGGFAATLSPGSAPAPTLAAASQSRADREQPNPSAQLALEPARETRRLVAADASTKRAETKTREVAVAVNEAVRRSAPVTGGSQVPPATAPARFIQERQSDSEVATLAAAPAIVAPPPQPLDSLSVEKNEAAPRQPPAGIADRSATTAPEIFTEVALDSALADKTFRARGGGEELERPPLNSQAFSNLGPAPLQNRYGQAKIPPPVLAKFKIQQVGRDVRVVDEDGSIYRGVVDEANTVYSQFAARQNQQQTTDLNKNAKLLPPKLSADQKKQDAAFYFYRVEGTNRTLNQNVVFTWNFVPTNEAVAATQLNYKDVLTETDPAKLPAQFPALLQNSYINGRAQFGADREVEVNAAPVKQ